jgi:bifunctional enzyme CysN/CysC
MNLVVTGHVDHGKSTVVGRLLADTGSLPEGKLEAIRALCARNSKPFEYAFLLDALRDERAQGITIDAARVFFKSSQRDYLLLDAPGHSEFLRNMITGAARAEAALLVIDAREGVRDNSRRHGYLLSLLGIRQLAVIVNKMDLVDRSRDVFDRVAGEYQDFLSNLQVTPSWFIPVSGMTGENIVQRASELPWYSGPTVLEALDAFTPEPAPVDAPFRMPVQGVYKFTANNDDRRIVAGSVATGRVRVGDELIFLPSGKQSRVKTIEAFARPEQTEVSAGAAAGLTLTDHIFVGRGEIAVRADEQLPSVTTRLRASVFWLGRDPLVKDREYHLKLGSARVPVRLDEVHRVLDVSSLAAADDRVKIDRHEVADCTLVASKPLAFDTADVLGQTSRFVLVDRYQIAGGGVIREALPDSHAWVRGAVLQREHKWTHSLIPQERRAERYAQRPGLLVITGAPNTGRKALARGLEERLFNDGRFVYFLGIGNVLYGVDADIQSAGAPPDDATRMEHVRRLGEVSNILLDAGLIVIATAAELSHDDLNLLRTSVGAERVVTAWIGEPGNEVAGGIARDTITTDVQLVAGDNEADQVLELKRLLQERRLIFSY